MKRRWFSLGVLLFLATSIHAAQGATGDQVLLAYRTDSKDSKQIARHYADVRAVPAANMCGISGIGADDEAISRPEFEKKVLPKIKTCLENADKSKILYIVLSYGFPFRLSNMPEGSGWAMDQYLALPFDKRPGSRINNPYSVFNNPKSEGYAPFRSLTEFRSTNSNILLYSVWRLDGPTPKIARALVDKAVDVEKNGIRGIGCFDRRMGKIEDVPIGGSGVGDWRIFRAAHFARQSGFKVLEDDQPQEFGTPPAPQRCKNAVLYAGWYSYNNYNDAFDWAPGAIGIHTDSASCLNPRKGKNWCANALEKGITATSGAVAEPFLEDLPKPDGVIHDLLEGANIGDAFLRNTAWLRWMVINLGDPLYRLFPKSTGKSSHAQSR